MGGVRGYAFVLDVEKRLVTMHWMFTLERDFWRRNSSPAAPD